VDVCGLIQLMSENSNALYATADASCQCQSLYLNRGKDSVMGTGALQEAF
jgi:hypothetical protein